jgi:hypothetical protein
MVVEQASPRAAKSAERIEGAMIAGGDMVKSGLFEEELGGDKLKRRSARATVSPSEINYIVGVQRSGSEVMATPRLFEPTL